MMMNDDHDDDDDDDDDDDVFVSFQPTLLHCSWYCNK